MSAGTCWSMRWRPTGVIEGIESTRHRFCLGVQWHPEYEIDQGDARILKAFIAACLR